MKEAAVRDLAPETGAGRQADRSSRTRRKIIEAAVACVDEEGFPRTTVQRIARKAGLTVGAVQHHFDSKSEVLRGVLDASFEHFSGCFLDVTPEGRSLEERVRLFVERAWLHCGSPTFRSTVEILLATRSAAADIAGHWSNAPLGETVDQARRLWVWLFDDLAISEERHLEILGFAFATLHGIAMSARIQSGDDAVEAQLHLLECSLLAVLREAAPGSA